MPEPFIRPYEASDFDQCLHVFYETIDNAINFEPARTIGSWIWYRPYVTITPGTCFVLDDGSGRAVGYLIGTENTSQFAERWKQTYIPMIDARVATRPDPDPTKRNPHASPLVTDLKIALFSAECSMLGSSPLLDQYPAHLHVDILPEYQGKGHGQKLMNEFLTTVKSLGANGVHLGMVRTNDKARKFYEERIGFHLCKEILDSGKSGEVGRHGDAICLVKAL